MDEPNPYAISLDARYGYLEPIDAAAIIEGNVDSWRHETLTRVEGSLVRLGIVEGEFHWHKHDDTDEFFFVLEGRLHVEVEDEPSVELGRHQGFNVPKGAMHRTRAPAGAVMLMVSAATVQPTGSQ